MTCSSPNNKTCKIHISTTHENPCRCVGSSIPLLSFIPKENPMPTHSPNPMAYPLHTLHPPFWFILGGSLCEDLELFNSFKTSPRSSKSEFVCKSYACFSIGFQLFFYWSGVQLVSSTDSFGRNSDGFRTSDPTDVRNSTDVRNLHSQNAPTVTWTVGLYISLYQSGRGLSTSFPNTQEP